MNRRGFLSSLAGVVALAKSGFSVSPAAAAIPQPCVDVYSQAAGSNTIDTIVSVGTGSLTVNNSSFFRKS